MFVPRAPSPAPQEPSAQVASIACSPLWLKICHRHIFLTRRALPEGAFFGQPRTSVPTKCPPQTVKSNQTVLLFANSLNAKLNSCGRCPPRREPVNGNRLFHVLLLRNGTDAKHFARAFFPAPEGTYKRQGLVNCPALSEWFKREAQCLSGLPDPAAPSGLKAELLYWSDTEYPACRSSF